MGIFLQSYSDSDFFGKLIFVMLFILSVACWTVLIRKFRILKTVRSLGKITQEHMQQTNLKNLLFNNESMFTESPFSRILFAISSKTSQIINKNQHFQEGKAAFLSQRDMQVIEEYSSMTIYQEIKTLGSDLFILSTIVTLAPFVGILGTVWGILICLGELQKGGGGSNSIILAGLSTALATTVLGLVIAIPALIAYNYLRSAVSHINSDLEGFTHGVLSELELQYRHVEV